MDSVPIDSALILAGTRIFNRPGEPSPARPLTDVGGLSLFQRTVLTLQRGGISRFVVLAGDETEALNRQLHGDERIKAGVRWLPVREFPPGDPRTWEALAGMFGGPYLVAGTGAVFPASLVARMREHGAKGETVIVVRDEMERNRLPNEVGAYGRTPLQAAAGLSQAVAGVVTVEEAATLALDVDLAAIPVTFTSPGWASAQDGEYPLQAAIERGVRQGQVRILPLGGDWYQDVCAEGTATPEQAEWTLLRSLKGGLEGFVDRHFNRKCSKWITLALLQTPLTPNGVTVLAALVGLLSGAVFALGGYAAGIAGALLFQLSAILDCCDGEVARLKFMESPFGEQLDVALDNVVHVGLYAGMGWAAYQSGWGIVAPALGGLAIVGNVAAFAVVQRVFRVREKLAAPHRRLVEAILNRLVSRDFSVLILALALLGHVEWFLALAAVGSNIFWPTLAWQLRSPS
ncbi:MAG: CDP-alcohol phosphatidyltransferase family protein, partial [Nitrospirae bacterium]|nr:CDP-alcohol phosphatidyltransferase family protein [Nitrospirota bacterium]